jgi:hypothetical protein
VAFPANKYRRLAQASTAELASVTVRLGGSALRWESLDEDILVDDAAQGRFPRHRPERG